jgi:hypothetical protein
MIEPHDLVPGALITDDVEAGNCFNACRPPRACGERERYKAPNREERPPKAPLEMVSLLITWPSAESGRRQLRLTCSRA